MSVSETAAGVPYALGWVPRGVVGDARLSRLAARGDRRAFEAIFERYHQELYRYCRAIVRDPDEAQDALQSTMASALRALPGDHRRIALRPWLYRVAHNEAISILRQRATSVDPDRLPEPEAPGVHFEAEARERLRDLVCDLDQLPERQRGALVMRELSGLSYAEIGAALTASEAAARQAVYEARASLRALQGGREMQCETARRAISERDGRVLRGRRVRAHLRTCESCRDFRTAIAQRRSDLRSVSPPMPGLAASGLLAAVLSEAGSVGGAATGAAAAGSAGVAGGTVITGSAAVKGASIAAAVVIGAGAADMSGVAKLPLVGRSHDPAPSAAIHGVAGQAAGARTSRPQGADGSTMDGSRPDLAAVSRGGSAQNGQRQSGGVHRADRPPASERATHGNAQSSGGDGTLPATSNGSPSAHSQAGGASHGNGRAGADKGHPHPSGSPGLANAAANAPTIPEHASGKPGSPPGHARKHGSAAEHPASSGRSKPR
jgi:RNA polymerase sigma factor (sigma-70 family)